MAVLNTEKLIEEVEKRPAIWDAFSDDYTDRYVRKRNWNEIVDAFVEGGEVDTRTRKELEYTLMKKWKCVRGCFARELTRQRAIQSGKNPGPRKSEYVHFKQLQFLTNSVKLKSADPVSRADTTDSESSQEETELMPMVKRIKEEKFEIDDRGEGDPLQYTLNTSVDVKEINSFEQDEDKMFLMSLLSTMKKVPENKKIATRIKIMAVLNEATQ